LRNSFFIYWSSSFQIQFTFKQTFNAF
jgi:hypothetical protein